MEQIKSLHPIPKDRKLRVAAYARISNDKEVLETSLAEQIKNYTSLIIQNPHWEFAGIYPDNGKSGSDAIHRKEFITMIENARIGLIDIILVKSVSRFARNLIDMLELVREFRLKGIEIYFEEQGISSLDTKCDQMITLCAKFAEEELTTISENVKWRYAKNKKEGKYALPPNLYGYKTINGEITIVPEEAKWIKTIYSMCLEGCGSSMIIKYLEQNHVPSPTENSRWGHNTICSILRNEKYAGDALIQKTIKPSIGSTGSSKNRGEEEMVLVRNGHTPIVNRETWNNVQAVLNERCEHFRVNRESRNPVSEFTGFVVCAHCGCNYNSKVNHYYGRDFVKAKRFLICNSNRHTKNCKGENIPVDEFKLGLALLTKKIKDNISYFKELLIKGFSSIDVEEKKNRIHEIDERINSLKEQLKEFVGKFDDYSTSMTTEIMETISSLTIEKMNLENAILIVDSAETRAKAIISEFNKLPNKIESFDDFDYKNLYSRAYVKSKDDILIIVGSKDVSKLKLSTTGELQVEVPYTVRITTLHLKLSLYVNI